MLGREVMIGLGRNLMTGGDFLGKSIYSYLWDVQGQFYGVDV